jgi:hypothetical protein
MPNKLDVSPWYKQFWPWFLIVLPTSSIVVGMLLLRLALNTEDSLVKDDYYKHGKAINHYLIKQKKARELGIATQITVSDKQFELRFLSGQPAQATALTLALHHPTLANRDQTLKLIADAQGTYRSQLEHSLSGKWQLNLTPYDNEWKVQDTLYFFDNKRHYTFSAQ